MVPWLPQFVSHQSLLTTTAHPLIFPFAQLVSSFRLLGLFSSLLCAGVPELQGTRGAPQGPCWLQTDADAPVEVVAAEAAE